MQRNPLTTECVAKVRKLLGDSSAKTYVWFYQANPLLGYRTPVDLIKNNQETELLKFIDNLIGDRLPLLSTQSMELRLSRLEELRRPMDTGMLYDKNRS